MHNQWLEIFLLVQLVSLLPYLLELDELILPLIRVPRAGCSQIHLSGKDYFEILTFETVLIESSFSYAMWLNKNKTRMVSLLEVQATYNQGPQVRHMCRNTPHFWMKWPFVVNQQSCLNAEKCLASELKPQFDPTEKIDLCTSNELWSSENTFLELQIQAMN